MNIIPISTGIPPIGSIYDTPQQQPQEKVGQPNFLDVFKQIFGDAVEGNQIKDADRIRLMLGDADDLEQIQLNMQKAEIATELLVNVRNSVLESYNEIIRMQV